MAGSYQPWSALDDSDSDSPSKPASSRVASFPFGRSAALARRAAASSSLFDRGPRLSRNRGSFGGFGEAADRQTLAYIGDGHNIRRRALQDIRALRFTRGL